LALYKEHLLNKIEDDLAGRNNNWDALEETQADVEALQEEKLDIEAYTAEDVLAKLVTVDGTGSGLDADLLRGVEPNKLLWAGSLSTGSITVPGLQDYTLFIVAGSPGIPGMIGVRTGSTSLHVVSTRTYASGNLDTYHGSFSISGNNLSFTNAIGLRHTPSGGHGAWTGETITRIRALI